VYGICVAMAPVVLRRRVPNDHSCLFWAVAYVAEGAGCSRSKAHELREVCAQDALNDADPATRALLLGMNSIEEYATWIRNDFHWGGENEVMVLAKHYGVEVAVVCCESLHVLCYGSDNPGCTERVYVLYTGQHYDPLVSGDSTSVPTSDERRRFPKGDTSLEAAAIEIARTHNQEAAKRAGERRAKRIKCLGCGEICDDAEAFATHCGKVEHDDEFAYECEEVEVVIEAGGSLPEGSLDLSSADVHSFYNTEKEPLSHLYPASTNIDGITYATLEHYWQCAPFLGRDAELTARIAKASTTQEASCIAHGAGPDAQRPDWRDCRDSLLINALRAKFSQHADVAESLLGTGEKTIVCVDVDPWAGMQAPGGIASGQNHVGKALMAIRAELRAAKSPGAE